MPQTATIKSLPAAFAMMKAMRAEDVEWGEDYRAAASQALAELVEGRMEPLIDELLERMAELGQADRRNGCYTRWLLTELGLIELHVPRTQRRTVVRHIQISLGEHLLDVTQAQREPGVQPDRAPDHFGRKAVTLERKMSP